MLRIHLLGKCRVEIDGVSVDEAAFSRLNALAVLKVLALEPARCVATERLVDLLWPMQSLQRGTQTLHVALHSLRRALEPARPSRAEGRFLHLKAGQLSLGAEADVHVDVDVFEQCILRARTASQPRELYEQALALHRGPLDVHGLPEEPAAEQGARFHALYCATLRALADISSSEGDWQQSALHWQRLLLAEPGDEAAHRALAKAYLRLGRSEAARAQLDACVRWLREQSAAKPSPETRALMLSLSHDSGDTQDGAAVLAGNRLAVSRLVPAYAGPLLGRDKDVASVIELLQQPYLHLISLTGIGGIGKTRLADAVAQQLDPQHFGSVRSVALAAFVTTAQAIAAIAAAIEVSISDLSETDLVAALRSFQGVLIIDNAEHLPELTATLLRLIEGCPQLKLLVTTRSPLGLSCEQLYAVEPLPMPPSGEVVALEQLARIPSVALFMQRARNNRPGFMLSKDTVQAVSSICRQVDGIPLAIELAASRLRSVPVDVIASNLLQSLDVLRGGPVDAPSRHASMEAALNWTYLLLDEQARSLFMLLGVFKGGVSPQALIYCQQALGIHNHHAFDSLVNHALLVSEEGPATNGTGNRFSMLQTVFAYADHRLLNDGLCARFRVLMADFFLSAMGNLSEGNPDDVNMAERENENLMHALRWAVEAGEKLLAARVSAILSILWTARAHFTFGRQWLARVAALPGALPAEVQCQLGLARGAFAMQQFEWQEGEALIQESLACAVQSNLTKGIARAANLLGACAGQAGQPQRAVELVQTALVHYRLLNDTSNILRALNNLALAQRMMCAYAQSRETLMKVASEAEQAGVFDVLVASLQNIAELDSFFTDYAHAEANLQKSLELARLYRYERYIPPALFLLGECFYQQCRFEDANRVLSDANQAAAAIGDFETQLLAESLLGGVAMLEGRLDDARHKVKLAAQMVAAKPPGPFHLIPLLYECWVEAVCGNLELAQGLHRRLDEAVTANRAEWLEMVQRDIGAAIATALDGVNAQALAYDVDARRAELGVPRSPAEKLALSLIRAPATLSRVSPLRRVG